MLQELTLMPGSMHLLDDHTCRPVCIKSSLVLIRLDEIEIILFRKFLANSLSYFFVHHNALF